MNEILNQDEIEAMLPKIIRSGTVIYRGSTIGSELQTGHNAVIREGNWIGNRVLVGVNTYLGPGNVIGNNVRIHTGCFLERVTLGDNVIVAPNATFTDDPYPPCVECMEQIGGAVVGENSIIGANATVLPGVRIGKNCIVGAGSVVAKDVEDYAVVVGNPARKINDSRQLEHKHKKL